MGYRDSYYSHFHFKTHKQVLYLDWQKDVFPTPDQLYASNNNVYQNSNGCTRAIRDRHSAAAATRAGQDNANNNTVYQPLVMNTEEELMSANGMVNLGTINQFWDYYHDDESFDMFQMLNVGPEGSILFNKKPMVKNNNNNNNNNSGSGSGSNVVTKKNRDYKNNLKPGLVGCSVFPEEVGGEGGKSGKRVNEEMMKTTYQDLENDELNSNNYKIYNLPKRKIMNHNIWPEYGLERFLVKLSGKVGANSINWGKNGVAEIGEGEDHEEDDDNDNDDDEEQEEGNREVADESTPLGLFHNPLLLNLLNEVDMPLKSVSGSTTGSSTTGRSFGDTDVHDPSIVARRALMNRVAKNTASQQQPLLNISNHLRNNNNNNIYELMFADSTF